MRYIVNTEDLDSLRKKIDMIDEKIVVLLIQRMNIALSISDIKENNIVSIQSKDRVSIVLERVARIATENNGDDNFIREIYSLIIEKLTMMQLNKKGLI